MSNMSEMEKTTLACYIKQARQISESTNQMDICHLTAEVANTLDWNPSFSSLSTLLSILSNALKGKYNNENSWLSEMFSSIDELAELI